MKKQKETVKKIPSKIKKTNEHYNAILLEDIDSKMQLVIEGMESTKTELNENMKNLEKKMDDRFDVLETVVRQNSKDITVLKQDVSVLKQDVSVLKQDVSTIKHDMNNMDERLSTKIDKLTDMVESHDTQLTMLPINSPNSSKSL